MHARLKDAMQRGNLQLFYQPQVAVASGHVIGVEALLRCADGVLDEVPPSHMVAAAQRTGLILPLSDWVLETACHQIAAWKKAGTSLRVAVNICAHQFRQTDLVDKVRSALHRTGAAARLLEVEITESTAMECPEWARAQLGALAKLGCTIALDGFGTGYASLACLKALPVSVLKIDTGIVKNIPHRPKDVKLSKSIIALAHSLEMALVAQGVETQEQLDFLRDHGCQAYQGWLFAKAMSAADLTALLGAAQHPQGRSTCAALTQPG